MPGSPRGRRCSISSAPTSAASTPVPADPTNSENAVYCVAQGYADVADATIVRTLTAVLTTGTMLFEDPYTGLRGWRRQGARV
jgi:hypothetical protein